jgi:hypothetical protein
MVPARSSKRVLVVAFAGVGLDDELEVGEVDFGSGAGLVVMGGGDQAQVVDAGRFGLWSDGLGDGAMGVAAGDEGGGDPGGAAV